MCSVYYDFQNIFKLNTQIERFFTGDWAVNLQRTHLDE